MNIRYLYIMGTDSGVGKSTVCLGILAQLLAYGYLPQQLAYIKPTTQCVEKQAVAGFCANNNIPFIGIGSLLFRKGFTQDFIDGLTPSSTELLATDIDIAALLPCRIIFVGKSGIGAAIDDTVLNVSFIQSKHKQNIGLIYNHCPLPDIANTRQYVSKRIVQLLPNTTPLGFIARDEEGLESFLQESSEKIAAWFDGYVNKSHLLTDWFALNEPQKTTGK
ncbi:MAG: AAA family ATPase [Methylococcaceae bacterium]|nr:AAA family ATPase [Methylococcaceae bacterium]